MKDVNTLIVRDSTFDSNVSHRGVIKLDQTTAVASEGDTVLFSRCLFVNNRARTDQGGALNVVAQPLTSLVRIEHCTFDNNECVNDAVDGQIYAGGTGVDWELHHCIITGADSTNAIRDANNEFSVIEHCDAWGNLDNWFSKGLDGSATDTLHLDPEYNCFAVIPACYRGNAPAVETCTDGSFMGWRRGTAGTGPPITCGFIGRGRGRRGRR